MSNLLGIDGGQPQKQTRFAPIYNGRWSSGIWTNRSPLRDANTTRLTERNYGAAGDALIAGSNVEITNRLTLGRRPGNDAYDANTFTNVDRFYSFRLFNSGNVERINVMVDEANALYSDYTGVKSLVWTKSTGAGQSYMQSVGNTLYFGNGVDNKKWLQTLSSWSALQQWNVAGKDFTSTFLIDPNGNVQQLTATQITITSLSITSNQLTIHSSGLSATTIVSSGLEVTFAGVTTETELNGQTLTINAVSGDSFTAAFTHANVGSHSDTGTATVLVGGTPVSGAAQPTWNTTVPSSGNNFQGGTTLDGTVLWTNRGIPVRNWGLAAPPFAPDVTVGSSSAAWNKSTFYSLVSVVVDSNGNLQQVTTAGKSGASTPAWATSVGLTTTDGTVTWTMIQTAASLVWAAHHTYANGNFIVASSCLFQLAPISTPYINGAMAADGWNSTSSGAFNKTFPSSGPDFTLVPLSLSWHNATSENTKIDTINGAGEITGQTDTGHYENWEAAITGTMHFRTGGQYSFTLSHDDGAYIGFGSGPGGVPVTVAGGYTPASGGQGGSPTAKMGYSPIYGNNNSGPNVNIFTINVLAAGDYPFEIDWTNWEHASQMLLTCNGQTIITTATSESGASSPVFPAWSTAFAPNYPSVKESANQYQWNNLGPVVDDTWSANINFTTPNNKIIDSNGGTEAPYRAGVTGTTAPTWATGLNQLTNDNPNLIWINQGPAAAPPPGSISAFSDQGFIYTIALVNSLDNTVSNAGPLTSGTGPFVGAAGITLAAGSGLPTDHSQIDPQADYVAIFRTTDGGDLPFLIPGDNNTGYTVSLHDYLLNGYVDTATDEELNNEISAAISGENTPPGSGAINLTYHLNRLFYSIGNTVYWSSGPDTPVGNGLDGTAPLNFDVFPSLVKRIVPLAIGALVFTVSDVYLIQGSGTSASPIQKGIRYLEGIGLLSYNTLAVNGALIGLYTTDKQFLLLDPSSGAGSVSIPIGNLIRQNTGLAGTTWNPATAYVTWHVNGEDQAWYLADGQFGWWRLMSTPAPETGMTWSPFATIVGGVKAVQSIEVSPGNHQLLCGPVATGPILFRNLDSSSDNSASYPAWAILGSMVLAQPGQIAEVSFITTESVKVGTPLSLAVILDEAIPYFTGPFETLKNSEPDPPGLPPSKSLLAQRFYLDQLNHQAAACRHMQVRVNWATEKAQNELLSLTVFGCYSQEQ